MTAGLKGKVRASRDVVFRELGGEMVLLNLKTGVYFGLNESGTQMWTLLMQGGEPAQVVDALAQDYDVNRAQLEKDLSALVRVLREKGLVEVDEK